MTQIEFATALRVSEKMFARYENGQATQGYAMDNLLRVLREFPEVINVISRRQIFEKVFMPMYILSADQFISIGKEREEQEEQIREREERKSISVESILELSTLISFPRLNAAQGI